MVMVIGRQIRAARTLLKITRATLSKKSGVPEITIQAVENEHGDPKASALDALSRALSHAGIKFIDDVDGEGPGVRLKKPLRR